MVRIGLYGQCHCQCHGGQRAATMLMYLCVSALRFLRFYIMSVVIACSKLQPCVTSPALHSDAKRPGGHRSKSYTCCDPGRRLRRAVKLCFRKGGRAPAAPAGLIAPSRCTHGCHRCRLSSVPGVGVDPVREKILMRPVLLALLRQMPDQRPSDQR